MEFCIFKLVLVPNFSLNWQFWFLLIRFAQKGFFWPKQEKRTPPIFYIILHIHISLVQTFSSNWQFWFLGSNLPKKVFPVKNRRSEHHHGTLYIWISLDTKFQLKLIILSFWTKFTQERYFQSKTEQAVQGIQAFTFYVVSFNSTVVFKHFKDLKDLIVLNILKEKLVISSLFSSFYLNMPWLVKPWLNFDLDFSFKILYIFTGQLKKLKFGMVVVKNLDKDHHFSNFLILVTILLFHDYFHVYFTCFLVVLFLHEI